MKRVARVAPVIVLLLWTMMGALPAAAQGPIVEPPPDVNIERPVPERGVALQLIEERVEVTIEGQVATTRLAQTFRNPSEWALEGEYLFPLPPDASIRDMDMTVDGVRLEGELMPAEQAREIYEEIVRRRMDPALLEWMGNGLFRTHIFPIPPGETRLIELEYTQLLTAEGGLFNYRFPLRQATSEQGVADVSISVELLSDVPLRAIYSPSHDVDILRENEQDAVIGWEGQDVVLTEDFSLFWSVSPQDVELNLLSYKEAGEDGFFMLLAAPPIEPPDNSVVARDVVVVLDVSGSMEGEKLAQAKDSLRFVLEHLNPADRFDIIAFSTGTRAFARTLQSTSEAPAALRWVEGLEAAGSTDISRALLEAMALDGEPGRPMVLLFLTDGLPTAGVTGREEILNLARRNAPEGLRLFSFGVGYDVDTVLLDSLASEMRGSSSYVTPDERIDEEVSAFYETISAPVLSDVRIDWGETNVEELYPSPLPDLFAGQQLIVAGRYREGGTLSLALEGSVNGEPQRFTYDDLRLAENGESEQSWIPRLWATRKIGTLLRSIRQSGESQEAIEEIIDLSIRYGIVTPYTTFLVDEGETFFDVESRRDVEERAMAAPAMAEDASGATAVEESEAVAQMAEGEMAPGAPTAVRGEDGTGAAVIRTVGARTFVHRNGVWIDTLYNEQMPLEPVPFGSDSYFALAARSPEVARYLSIGAPLILVVDGVAYEIVEGEAPITASPTGGSETPTLTPLLSPTATVAAISVAPDASPEAQGQEAPVATPGGNGDANARLDPGASPLFLTAAAGVVIAAIAAWVMVRRRAGE